MGQLPIIFAILSTLLFCDLSLARPQSREPVTNRTSPNTNTPTNTDANPQIDLLLVLAVDVSSSVAGQGVGSISAEDEYLLQKQGIIKVLQDPDITEVLERCNSNGVAITYMEWSHLNGLPPTRQLIPWTLLKNRNDLNEMASLLDAIKRSGQGETDVATALRESQRLIETAPFRATRRVIAISGDGAHSWEQGMGISGYVMQGVPWMELAHRVRAVRDEIVKQGTSIDGLVIMRDPNNQHEPLDEYFEKYVAGGPGHMVVPIETYYEYASGLKEKLLKELNNCLL